MKRVIFVLTIVLSVCVHLSAQDLKVRDVFRMMPDSLMPYLTQNNRLDFIDFLDSGMKAEVRNLLGGKSEMTALADDSLSINMSESLVTEIILLTLSEPADSIDQVIVIIESYHMDSTHGESSMRYYTPAWQPINGLLPFSEDQRKRIQYHLLQNVLNYTDGIPNKS